MTMCNDPINFLAGVVEGEENVLARMRVVNPQKKVQRRKTQGGLVRRYKIENREMGSGARVLGG